jgi:NADH-quinone oxidoreductase subunit N
VVDHYALILKAIFLLVAYVVVLMSQNELEEGGYYQGEFYVLMLCSVLGMVMMASSRDLVSIFVALELLSIPAYMMAAWRKRDVRSNEAGVKYYLLGVFASAVLLYGMSFLYGTTGSTKLWSTSAPCSPSGDLIGLQVLGDRVRDRRTRVQGVGGAVPHVGARHLRGRAHAGHRVLVGGVEGGRLRGAHDDRLPRVPHRQRRLPAADLGARGAHDDVGNVIALRQTNIVRMLAYSSVSQGGFILMPLAVAGTGTATRR